MDARVRVCVSMHIYVHTAQNLARSLRGRCGRPPSHPLSSSYDCGSARSDRLRSLAVDGVHHIRNPFDGDLHAHVGVRIHEAARLASGLVAVEGVVLLLRLFGACQRDGLLDGEHRQRERLVRVDAL
jgi:hypothetical protein